MAVDHRRVAVVAVLAGVALGAVDFALQKTLPYPWANLANSSAVWAVAAFALGWWIRTGWLRAAIAAACLLVIAVPSYYLTATLVQQDDLANAWTPTAMLWMIFGLLAGAVFGTAGVWARESGRWRPIVGTALPGAVLLAEAILLAKSSRAWTAVIEVALAVVVIMLVGRTAKQRLLASAVTLPLAAIGYAGFQLAGFSRG